MKEKIQKFSGIFISVLGKVIVVAIVGFILYNIGRSIWKNYLIVQKIDSAKKEITNEELENKNLKNLIVYYQTDTYKELEARRKLGYKKPGESVLMIPELSTTQNNNTIGKTNSSAEPEQSEANFIKWYHYVIK